MVYLHKQDETFFIVNNIENSSYFELDSNNFKDAQELSVIYLKEKGYDIFTIENQL